MNKTSSVTEFVLLGLESDPRWVLNLILVMTYSVLLTGNILVIILVLSDVQLQIPMYFFLCNLSLLEIVFTSTVIPKMLYNSFSLIKTISKLGCFLQCFFYFLFGTSEMVLLAVMSFDRYVAICQPLHYNSIVNHKICFILCFGCWLIPFIFLLFPITFIGFLPFCGPNIINHFFCDSTLLIKLSCADVHSIELLSFTAFSFFILGSLLITTISYIYIIIAVLSMSSRKRGHRTFSTCIAHLTVVLLYYGSSIYMYIRDSQNSSFTKKMVIALVTAVITPVMTPFIYSLRNKKVKEAFTTIFYQSSGIRTNRLLHSNVSHKAPVRYF